MIDVAALRIRYRRIAGFLDERGRRLFAANEALELGRGGVTAVSAASGIARSTINRGIAELRAGRNELGARIRRRGGGRKRAVEGQPGLLAALEGLIEGAIRGDPQSPLRWVSRSQRNIAAVLGQQGFEASQKLVGVLLRQLDYSCQANRKTREGTQHPDRNAQFEYINVKVKAALAAGQPAISVDTKKKELVGDFKNGGRELRRKGEPEPVRVHDFEIKGLGRLRRIPGRPPGLVNKLTREMQDAVLAAAEELGAIDFDKWPEQLKGDPENSMKQFYKVLAIKELKTFGIILARMMPKFVHRTTTQKDVPVLLTEEQVLAELKEAGIPLDVIKHMHAVDVTKGDTFQLDGDPYDDPEDDEDQDQMVDVTPKKDAAE